MLALGVIDDRRNLSAKWKFTGQVLIALAVAASGIRVTIFVESPLFSYAVTVLWILTVTNAVNFQDNMNGLCAGLGLIAGWFFAWHAGLEGQYLVASLAFLFTGALAGFLPYNFPRGGVFLGDGGSHVVGFLLAVLAILPDFYSAASQPKWLVLTPLIVLAVPLADLVSVILIRLRLGQTVWVGDNNHFSHRLVRAGLAKPRAVLILLLIAAAIRHRNIFEVNGITRLRRPPLAAGRRSRARVARATRRPACRQSLRSGSATRSPRPA